MTLNPKVLMYYGIAIFMFSVSSFLLPYHIQVNISIASGFAVAILLPTSMIFSRGFKLMDLVFFQGIFFLVISLVVSELPFQPLLDTIRHSSLILSVILTGLYVVLTNLKGAPIKSLVKSTKQFNTFLSVCSTTLSSELCTCLHPTLFLEALGIAAFLPDQVKLGFVIMMTTLSYQIRLTYKTYQQRRLNISRDPARVCDSPY